MSLFDSPETYPVELRLDEGLLVFAAMSEDDFAAHAFHDARCVGRDDTVYLGRLPRLLERLPAEAPPRPLHFVAHTAFCRSTLLSRLLGELRSCLAVREPHVLVQLAERPDPELLALATALLARSFRDDQATVVKLNDRCNGLVPELLAREPHGRGLLLHGELDEFLVSVLGVDGRRVWLRRHRLPAVRAAAASLAPLADIDPDGLSDAEAAAYLWLFQVLRFRAWALEHDRLELVSATDLVERPRATLAAAARHLGLPASDGELDRLAGSPLLGRHAKDTSVAYDPAARAAQRERLAPELEAGRAFVESIGVAA